MQPLYLRMHFNPGNPVVKLCAEGMAAEFAGEMQKAHLFFLQAWELAATDFEKFTAAHYVARNQADPEETLRWNLLALQFAIAIDSPEMKPHFSSLYLNAGKSYEDLGENLEALRQYRLAEAASVHLPNDPYGDMIRFGIKGGLQRAGK